MAHFYEDDRNLLADAVADCLPPPDVIMKASPANYAMTKFGFNSLVDLRCAHETHQAKKSCRVQQGVVPDRMSQRQDILRAFHAIMKRNKEQRLGSGLHRKQQYGSSPSTVGNSANAKLAATARASTARYITLSLKHPVHMFLLKGPGSATQRVLSCRATRAVW